MWLDYAACEQDVNHVSVNTHGHDMMDTNAIPTIIALLTL